MSLDYPCVHFDNQKCKRSPEPGYTDWCVMGPCSHETPSRADLIRRMTDEELADMFVKFENYDGPDYCQRASECDEMLDRDEVIPLEKCKACMTAWLQQPAEHTEGGATNAPVHQP